MPVAQVMTIAVRALHEAASIESALTAMQAEPFRRIPVVCDEGKLVGLLSLDVLEIIGEEFGLVRRLIGDESPTSLGREEVTGSLRRIRDRVMASAAGG